ncbi:MAG: MmgE/PrpD family protein [Pseudomonadota bacterium]|nr:MmgE/PrpD family protein [Pseudomonadota bacterium]
MPAQQTGQTMAQMLAHWAADTGFGDLPDAVVADARLRILDTLGLILGAADSPIGRAVRQAALGMGKGHEARAFGTGDLLPVGLATLIDGTLAHAADFDDTHDLSVVHPSATAVPLALALAQACSLSGAETLLLVALCNEINCRIGSGAPGGFHAHGYHPTSVTGTLAVAITATLTLGGTPAQAVHAAGISGSQAAGLMEAFADGTWSKTMHPGWACHSGLAAAALARAGFTGPASILEGRFGLYRSHVQDPGFDFRPDLVVDGLGQRWEILATSFKPYPCAHAIHAFVDAALALRAEHGLTADTIAGVKAVIGEKYVPLTCEPVAAKLRPATPTHARASLPYALSVALVKGGLGPEDYADTAIADPAVLALAERFDWDIDRDPPGENFRGIVEITTTDGRMLRHVEPANRGSRANPLSREDLIAKFRQGTPHLGAGRQLAVIAAIDDLDVAPSIDSLLRACQ